MPESKYPKLLTVAGPFAIAEQCFRLCTSFFSLIDSYQASLLSMLYLYIILQLVGLLWAFVTNAALSLGLMVAKEVGKNAWKSECRTRSEGPLAGLTSTPPGRSLYLPSHAHLRSGAPEQYFWG